LQIINQTQHALNFLLSLGIPLVIAAIALSGSCYGSKQEPPLVEYRIEGTAEYVTAAVINGENNTIHYTSIKLPHSFQYYQFESPILAIWAQSNNGLGSIKTSIFYNGKRVATNTSNNIFPGTGSSFQIMPEIME